MEYATHVSLTVTGKKFIFLKKTTVYFSAIYIDEKFYRKKKWPGHLGGLTIRFQGKGSYHATPSHLRLPRGVKVDEKNLMVHNGPNQEEFDRFLDGINGDFELLDSAKYASRKFNFKFDAFNCYDNKSGRYFMFIKGWNSKGGARKFNEAVKFVEDKIIKSFRED